MGAWIETSADIDDVSHGESHPMWVRGLKHNSFAGLDITSVAPYVGAWIETQETTGYGRASVVAPYVGAWIETIEDST